MPWAIDGITALIIVIFAVSAYRKGFLNTITMLFGTIASLIVSLTLSSPIARFVYDNCISEKVGEVVSRHMSGVTIGDMASFSRNMDSLINELPSVISGMLQSGFGLNIEKWYDKIAAASVEDIASAVEEIIVEPIAVGLLRVLTFFVLFLSLMLIVNIVAAFLKGVNHLPLIGTVNEVLGGVMGAVQGMLYVFVLAAVLWLMLSASGGEIGPVSEKAIDETLLFKHFYDIGPWAEMTADIIR